MSLREEIKEIVTATRYEWKKEIIKKHHHLIRGVDEYTDDIIKVIEKRIDELIEIDNQTLQLNREMREAKIAAQASKNTLMLVKEMLR